MERRDEADRSTRSRRKRSRLRVAITLACTAIFASAAILLYIHDRAAAAVPLEASTPRSHRREAPSAPPLPAFIRPLLDATPRPSGGIAPVRPSPESQAVTRFIRGGLPIYCGGGKSRVVALTFDDGPGPYSDELLRLLERHHVSATFFSVGRSVAARPEVTARQAELGIIGDHTWSHASLTRLRPRQIARQLGRTRDEIGRANGGEVSLFRPPYGARSPKVLRVARRMGLLEVLWSIDSRDWQFRRQRKVRAILEDGLRPGAIILMHEHGARTLPTISWLLVQLHRRKLKAVTIPELLAIDPPSRTQLEADARGSACVRYP